MSVQQADVSLTTDIWTALWSAHDQFTAAAGTT